MLAKHNISGGVLKLRHDTVTLHLPTAPICVVDPEPS